jgi:hypothetical protein
MQVNDSIVWHDWVSNLARCLVLHLEAGGHDALDKVPLREKEEQ